MAISHYFCAKIAERNGLVTSPFHNKNHEEVLQEDLQKRILALEASLAEAERRAQRAKDQWSDQYDASRRLKEDHHQLQEDYENLRLQKGGFGFKMLLASGFFSALFTLALIWVYLKFKPQPQHILVFDKFKKETLVNVELQLSRGDFDAILLMLEQMEKNPEYPTIQPEIEYIQKTVGAAKRACKGSQ